MSLEFKAKYSKHGSSCISKFTFEPSSTSAFTPEEQFIEMCRKHFVQHEILPITTMENVTTVHAMISRARENKVDLVVRRLCVHRGRRVAFSFEF